MLRSLFAGISGLRANQTMLDVTGNNIANANTIGFKSSSTIFQDTLSQMLTGASGSNAPKGGTNPIQIGLGVQLAATATNFLQGSAQTTGRLTDVMIQGDGFFVTRQGSENLYTRAGSFTFDENGSSSPPPATTWRATSSTPPAPPPAGSSTSPSTRPTRSRPCPSA
ncbi:MAG: flagellar hook-basal body complex protein [Nocardioidaceae bacterium]